MPPRHGSTRRPGLAAIACLAAAVLLCGASGLAAMPLQDAVRIGTERDPLIAALQQQVSRETTNIEIARDGRRPQLSISGETGENRAGDVALNVTVSQVLFDWGRINSQIAAASFERVRIAADLKMAVEDLTLQISELYLDIEMLDRKLDRTRAYVEFAARLEGFSRDRVAAGLTDSSEIARARLESARAAERMTQLRSDRLIAETVLEFLLGRTMPNPDRAPHLSFTDRLSTGAAIISAVTIAPSYVRARADVDIAHARVDLARASTRPTIRLQARGRQDLTGGRGRSGSVGLSAGVDLNAGAFTGRAVLAAQQELGAAESLLRGAERELQSVVRQFVQRLRMLEEAEQSLQRQVTDARAVLQVYEQQFIAGRRDLLDLLTTGRDLYDAEIQDIDISDERKRTEYAAAHSVGMLGTLLLATSR